MYQKKILPKEKEWSWQVHSLLDDPLPTNQFIGREGGGMESVNKNSRSPTFHNSPTTKNEERIISAIPLHLPKKLTISLWLWNYFLGAQKGDHYYDLEKRIVELKERGFNTIRIDSGIGLCYTREGTPCGPIKLCEAFHGYTSVIRQLNCRGGECDVLKRLISLFELCRKHDVYVILTSWFYQHTFWFVDTRIRQEMFALPSKDRFMYWAKENSRLIDLIKERGLHTQIAFVEIMNEVNGLWHLTGLAPLPEDEQQEFSAFRELHEEALAFLRAKHPDLLFAFDTGSDFVPKEAFPRNMQIWNFHLYYMWPICLSTYEADVSKPDFDFQNPHKYASIAPFLRKSLTTMEQIRNSTGGDRNILDSWYRRIWLYVNTDPSALKKLERWLDGTLTRNLDECRKRAADGINHAVSLRDENFPNIPLVVGEAASYSALTGMRWEEESDAHWSLIDYTIGLLRQNDFWGCCPRTNSGPEDPVWAEYPERLLHANRLFLAP